MLTENEILYIKTILKQQNENWENKSTLADIYRHAKFTIRKLSRQMALIDDIQIFKKIREPNIENTLFTIFLLLLCNIFDGVRISDEVNPPTISSDS